MVRLATSDANGEFVAHGVDEEAHLVARIDGMQPSGAAYVREKAVAESAYFGQPQEPYSEGSLARAFTLAVPRAPGGATDEGATDAGAAQTDGGAQGPDEGDAPDDDDDAEEPHED